ILLISAIAILIVVFLIYKSFLTASLKSIKINETEISVETAITPEEKAKGLSGREYLPRNRGMIFLFSEPNYYSFWMKDTLLSLDFIWIRGDEVVGITQNVRPEDYQPPDSLKPKEKVDSVVEVNAGFIEENGIEVGDKIVF
ncbi:MAG: DUF192 domain-containing protein, partial [Patescibacteria group bacterium]